MLLKTRFSLGAARICTEVNNCTTQWSVLWIRFKLFLMMNPLSINVRIDHYVCLKCQSCLCCASPHTHSKSQFHETTSGPVLSARWRRSTRTETMLRSWQLSAWLPEPDATDAMFKGPANSSPHSNGWKRCDDNMTEGKDGVLIRKKYGHLLISLHLVIWTTLPSQLAGPSPVFLGVT